VVADSRGRGSYGIFFRGTFKAADEDNKVKDVAVKRIDRFKNKIEEEILRLVNGHSNILHYYSTGQVSDSESQDDDQEVVGDEEDMMITKIFTALKNKTDTENVEAFFVPSHRRCAVHQIN